jgi:hypothetical protein
MGCHQADAADKQRGYGYGLTGLRPSLLVAKIA